MNTKRGRYKNGAIENILLTGALLLPFSSFSYTFLIERFPH